MVKVPWDSAAAITLVICALLTTGLVARREFLTPPVPGGPPKVTYIPGWRTEVSKGVQLGPLNAPVQLIEFADFECAFCGSFHNTLEAVRERYPGKVALTYIDFPIRGHRFAIPVARAADCAGQQGRFEAMYDQLFDNQESLGLKPWSEYAKAAGIPDAAEFNSCVAKTDPVARVEEGKRLGVKLDIQGTPTLIVNGWKLAYPPAAEELNRMVTKCCNYRQEL
jgi:protein-disulfide isomerase